MLIGPKGAYGKNTLTSLTTRPERSNQPHPNHESTDKQRVADGDKAAEAAAEETRRREKEREVADLLKKLERKRTRTLNQYNGCHNVGNESDSAEKLAMSKNAQVNLYLSIARANVHGPLFHCSYGY